MSSAFPALSQLDPALLAEPDFIKLAETYAQAFTMAAKELDRLSKIASLAQSLADIGASSEARQIMKSAGSETGDNLGAPMAALFKAVAPAYILCSNAVENIAQKTGSSPDEAHKATRVIQEGCLDLLPKDIVAKARLIFESTALSMATSSTQEPEERPIALRKRPGL